MCVCVSVCACVCGCVRAIRAHACAVHAGWCLHVRVHIHAGVVCAKRICTRPPEHVNDRYMRVMQHVCLWRYIRDLTNYGMRTHVCLCVCMRWNVSEYIRIYVVEYTWFCIWTFREHLYWFHNLDGCFCIWYFVADTTFHEVWIRYFLANVCIQGHVFHAIIYVMLLVCFDAYTRWKACEYAHTGACLCGDVQ